MEFTVQRQQQQAQGLGVGGLTVPGVEGVEGTGGGGDWLEEVSADERGATLIAKERLPAETFEVGVPIRVLGVPGMEGVGVEGVGMEV